jgi:hypothetical protein
MAAYFCIPGRFAQAIPAYGAGMTTSGQIYQRLCCFTTCHIPAMLTV